MRALVYGVNLELQQAYIDANLGYVKLLQEGGSGTGRAVAADGARARRAEQRARGARAVARPRGRGPARRAARFVRQVDGAVGQVGEFLRATANPVELTTEARRAGPWVLSAQVQAYALALALAFVAVILGAAALTAEREERMIGRLARGLVGARHARRREDRVRRARRHAGRRSCWRSGSASSSRSGGVSGGEPWSRLPLLVPGLVLASAAFGALGVLVGALARDAGTAMLLALLVGLPVALAGVIPAGAFAFAGWLRAAVPFGHAVDLATSALYDPDPWGSVLRQSLWLVALTLVFGGLARVASRRLLG